MSTRAQAIWIASLDAAFLDCRTLRHAWSRANREETPTEVLIDLECLRCTSHRIDRVRRGSGKLLGRRYRYVDGYIKPKTVKGRVDLDALRAEFAEIGAQRRRRRPRKAA